MQHDFATIAAQMDIPQAGAARRYGMKNLNVLKTKEQLRRKSPLPKITTRNKDQIMDRNNGLEAKISREKTGTLPMIDSGGVPLMATKTSLQDPTLHIGTTARMIEDHLTNAQISHSVETMETDPDMNLSTTGMGTGETMELFLVLHQIQEETSRKTTPIANQEMINLTTPRSADLIIDLRQTLCPMNRYFRRTIIRHHPMWIVSPQPMMP